MLSRHICQPHIVFKYFNSDRGLRHRAAAIFQHRNSLPVIVGLGLLVLEHSKKVREYKQPYPQGLLSSCQIPTVQKTHISSKNIISLIKTVCS